jgi:hypothetical protein
MKKSDVEVNLSSSADERDVLAKAIDDPSILDEENFLDEVLFVKYRPLVRAMGEIQKEGGQPDIHTIAQRKPEVIEQANYVWDFSATFADADIKRKIGILRELYSKRLLVKLLNPQTLKTRTLDDVKIAFTNLFDEFTQSKDDLLQKAIQPLGDIRMAKIAQRKVILSPWLLEKSLGLIFSDRGLGKSLFALGLADAITHGKPFGPYSTTNPVNILYIDSEMVIQDVQQRANESEYAPEPEESSMLYLCVDNLREIAPELNLNLMDQRMRDRLTKISEDQRIGLLILDNLITLLPGREINELAQWTPIQTWLIELRSRGISVLMLHHTGKGGQQLGTIGHEIALDYVIKLNKPPDWSPDEDARFNLEFTKFRGKVKDQNLLQNYEFSLRSVGGKSTWLYKTEKRKHEAEVLQGFADGMKSGEIAEMLGLDKGQVSRIKARLIEKELLFKDLTLTVKGESFLKDGQQEVNQGS